MLRRVGAMVLLGGMLVSGLGCSASGTDKLCDSYEDFTRSVQALKDVDVAEDGMSSLQGAVDSVSTSWHQLAGAAKGQFGPELDSFKASLDNLASVVSGLPDAASGAEAAGAVKVALEQVASSYDSLSDALDVKCA